MWVQDMERKDFEEAKESVYMESCNLIMVSFFLELLEVPHLESRSICGHLGFVGGGSLKNVCVAIVEVRMCMLGSLLSGARTDNKRSTKKWCKWCELGNGGVSTV